jgi:2-(1,2-epoxy-1,2-dihydrophenyl)acetyl-CoA isomerase
MERTSEGAVARRVEGNIGHITLNRADRMNAFDLELANQFLETLESFRRSEEVRAVVLRGAGRVFSVGGDVREMSSDVEQGKDRAAYFRAPLAAFHKVVLAIREIPKPVLAVVQGAVAGVAFNVMLACDLRLAAAGTRFTQAFVKLGLSPDGGGTYFLPRQVGYARACELAMLPTQIDAATAQSWGLVNWVVAPEVLEEEAAKIAGRLAAGPASALGRMKALMNQSGARSLADQLEAERLAQIDNAASPNFPEGLKAFLEKREPRFV